MTSIATWALLARAMMETGELEWNLAQSTQHRAGSALNVAFTITNPMTLEKQYQIWIGLFDLGGAVITTFALPDTFTVSGESSQSFSISVKVDYSNCILEASLYDVETGGMGAALQTVLEQPASLVEQISPALIGAMTVGVVGAFLPKVLKGKGA